MRKPRYVLCSGCLEKMQVDYSASGPYVDARACTCNKLNPARPPRKASTHSVGDWLGWAFKDPPDTPPQSIRTACKSCLSAWIEAWNRTPPASGITRTVNVNLDDDGLYCGVVRHEVYKTKRLLELVDELRAAITEESQ